MPIPNLPKFRIKYGEQIGNELYFQLPDTSDELKSYFDADAGVGSGSLTANGAPFAVSQYLVLGMPGQLKSEIVQIHAVTAPTALLITLVGTTAFDHNRGDAIRFVGYNQIVPERSTDGGATYTPLAAINLRADATETILTRTGDASTDYYRFRFFNSNTSLYSAYSAGQIATGLADNTVGSVMNRALHSMGEKISDLITKEFLLESINEGRRELDNDPRVFRWSFRTKFHVFLGQIIPGQWSVAVPTDLRDPNTNKNILNIEMARVGDEIPYVDEDNFRENYYNVANSTLSVAATAGQLSITLTKSGDFTSPTGSISLAAQSATGTITTIAYTGNNVITNVITLPALAANVASGTNAWQGVGFGLPGSYTINAGVIYFDTPFSNQYAGQNMWISYYSTLVNVTSEISVFDEPDPDAFVSFLKWKIKYLKSNGSIDMETDTDHKEWLRRKDAMVTKDTSGQFIYFVPKYRRR